MLIIKKFQYQIFLDNIIHQFTIDQIKNLKEKQPEKINEKNNEEIKQIVQSIINWGLANNIKTYSNLEYLINVCIKYNISEDFLKHNEAITEIFTYPDRKEDNKLFLLHEYLAYNSKNGREV
jgi:hypothetical protein